MFVFKVICIVKINAHHSFIIQFIPIIIAIVIDFKRWHFNPLIQH